MCIHRRPSHLLPRRLCTLPGAVCWLWGESIQLHGACGPFPRVDGSFRWCHPHRNELWNSLEIMLGHHGYPQPAGGMNDKFQGNYLTQEARDIVRVR